MGPRKSRPSLPGVEREEAPPVDLATTLRRLVIIVGEPPNPITREPGSGMAGVIVETQAEVRALTEAFDARERAHKAADELAITREKEELAAAENSPARRVLWIAVAVAVTAATSAAITWLFTLHH